MILALQRLSIFPPPEYNILGYRWAFCKFFWQDGEQKSLKKKKNTHKNNNKTRVQEQPREQTSLVPFEMTHVYSSGTRPSSF